MSADVLVPPLSMTDYKKQTQKKKAKYFKRETDGPKKLQSTSGHTNAVEGG